MADQRRHGGRLCAWELTALAVLLGAYLLTLVKLSDRTGVTVDEPSHIVSAILYWEGNDRLLPRDMPPLIKIVGGWAAGEAGFRIVEESHPVWKTNHEWNISMDMMRRMGEERIRSAMRRVRLPLLIFPLGTALLLWWWGRQLFGPAVGLLCAMVFVCEPTALGHGALFKNDHAAAFGYLLFWYAAWRYWREPGLGTALGMGMSATVAILAKLSLMITLPLAVAVAIAGGRRMTKGRWAAAVATVAAVPYAVSIAACQFETRWYGALPLPAPLWDGVQALVFNVNAENAVYLWGERYPWGHRGYFALAWLVKTPELLLALVLAGLGVLIWRAARRELGITDLFWTAPGALYFAMASVSPLQLGYRLALPALPFAALVCGAVLQKAARRWWVLGIVAAGLAVPVLFAYPYYLSYFNMASGGPRNGLRYLADSNVDWGQDLRELRRYMRKEGIERMSLSYMGSDNPLAYFRMDRIEYIQPPFQEGYNPVKIQTTQYRPGPGVYAISANLISGQFFTKPYRDYYKAFREAKPIAYAGYSIYIYRFP